MKKYGWHEPIIFHSGKTEEKRAGMTIIEAIKSGKNYRREKGGYFIARTNCLHSLTREDILADDWEIEEQKIEITEAQLKAAYKRACEKPATPSNTTCGPALYEIIRELGFK